jgi:hypothetical protein
MSKLRMRISMSLDGFVAGPEQSVRNPLGIGGEQLHGWAIELAAWRAQHGMPGGEVNESTLVMEESQANIGATDQARKAAGGKDISLSGGAKACAQYLKAGLVDEMEVHIAPMLLGSGERLFDGAGSDLHGLKLVRTVATPQVVHLKFSR